MPIYDLRCPRCKSLELNVFQVAACAQPACLACGEEMERVWLKGPPVHTFQAGYFENAADEDGKVPYFNSRRKYKDYLKEHGMYAEYVDGY